MKVGDEVMVPIEAIRTNGNPLALFSRVVIDAFPSKPQFGGAITPVPDYAVLEVTVIGITHITAVCKSLHYLPTMPLHLPSEPT